MALFSGGRYIRAKLRDAFTTTTTTPLPTDDDDAATPQTSRDERAGLSFWDFPGAADGEDLKLLYKSRVAALSPTLTDHDRADIVAESVEIMLRLTDVVREVAETAPAAAQAWEQEHREEVERRWSGGGD
ncbi:MAG: hypothetical protein LQ352_008249, partial [Teloschistes flavicans]